MTGALVGVVVLAGAVAAETVVLMRSAPEPAKKSPSFVLLPAPAEPRPNAAAVRRYPTASASYPTEYSAYGTAPPGYSDARPAYPAADVAMPAASEEPRLGYPGLGSAQPVAPVERPKSVVQKPAPDSFARFEPVPDQKKAAPARPPRTLAVATPKPQLQPATERWRVVTTAKASFFNLGGHVDRNGIVDSMATSRMRDMFKGNRNFERLPPDIKAHINTAPNIDLTRIAPYRVLLGIDDRRLEEEQGVRFERVASR
jgi:hypothetical protein